MGIKNDISFTYGDTICLYEHQSTANPNMPLRQLLYFAKQISTYIDDSIYSSTLIRLPLPNFVVFYNGIDSQPERKILRLSDAFLSEGEKTPMELEVLLINLNRGMNEELKKSCKTLGDYCKYIDMVREYRKDMSLDEAVKNAVRRCIKEGILAEYLIKYEEEMMGMPISLFEYDEEEEMRKLRKTEYKNGERAGVSRGIAIGEIRGETRGIRKCLISILESYGVVPLTLRDKISTQSDPVQLNEWLKTAISVSGIDEFRQAVNL